MACHTLGCKLNFAESSHLLRELAERGFETVEFSEPADVYIINSCTVTGIAEKKCRQAIHSATRKEWHPLVVVTGCYAQRNAEQLKQIEGVWLVVGNDRKDQLCTMICHAVGMESHPSEPESDSDDTKKFHIAYSYGDRTRSFLKIQDGCDYFCTYCAIPFARGRSRSATVSDVVEAASAIASKGVKEIVLTGINTGTFGNGTETFEELLRRLTQVEGIERYRISSIEPNLLTDSIVELVAGSAKLMPHFHVPLQAGSDTVLRAMHRRYDTALYAAKIELIKKLMPNACIAADLMTGFNMEGKREFEESVAFVESLPLSYLHVFTYSERPGTAAHQLGGLVPVAERRRRSAVMHDISSKKREQFFKQNVGSTHTVLWESECKNGVMGGWTDNYIRLQRPYNPDLVGNITSETISASNECFYGED
ncbi:MAG: tRNA (N(6)-L-threonylcarbamoyladenosine(37)-C(2))-methylthiotransferase MtaB [Bacteroidales bacterium]|nr:tRNA (N(6)-L-threonylcarbamoyladenosine(37)-C(2))-methylthiotransferase MtaB [Bacteroidales bacterium]